MSTEDPACYDGAVPGLGAFVSAFAGLAPALVPLPGTSSVTVPFIPAASCDACHGLFDREGSAFGTWAGSAMGHAARDPIYRAALVIAERDAPGVGDFCLRCHAPEAWLEGRCVPTDGSLLRSDDSGVGCAFCHRAEPTPYVRNGQYVVADDSVLRGPYEDPVNPDHATAPTTWLADARMCGTCHDLYNPLVERRDLDGSPTGRPFPEQTTYTEWTQSAFAAEGRTCQDCHMPKAPGVVARERPERPDRSSHGLAGGNAYLLSLIELLHPELNLSQELSRGVARNLALLRTAARLELTGPEAVICGEPSELVVRVVNESGHKLPTGYPDGRRVYLGVSAPALDIERGRLDERTGEPLAPLAMFYTEQGQHGLGPGHHLAKNDVVYFDNRLPPRGFVPTATTAPVGATYPELEPGVLAHYADARFGFEAPCDLAGTNLELEFFLHYQSATQSSLMALVADTEDHPAGDRLATAMALYPPRAYEIARLPLSLPVLGAAPPDAGVPLDAASDDDLGAPAPRDASPGDAPAPDAGPTAEDEGCACQAAAPLGGAEPAARLAPWALALLVLSLGRPRRRTTR